MRIAGLKRAALGLTLVLALAAQAAPPPEPAEARVVEVNVADRKILADGVTWSVEGTATIRVPGKTRASLRDLQPGMLVRLELAPGDKPEPLVRTVTVLPE